jgi:hypothetical protein
VGRWRVAFLGWVGRVGARYVELWRCFPGQVCGGGCSRYLLVLCEESGCYRCIDINASDVHMQTWKS